MMGDEGHPLDFGSLEMVLSARSVETVALSLQLAVKLRTLADSPPLGTAVGKQTREVDIGSR